MESIQELSKLIRYYILQSTTKAGSGHPTSSLSATDLMTVLFFGGFLRYDLQNPQNPNNDKIIFSKGHASPLFYSLWTAAGAISEEELMTLRQFGSRLEGHPTRIFPYTIVPTGSLGQGLSVGVGTSLHAKKVSKLPYKTYVLLGDSEMAEGSVWEAIQLAAYYKLDNLIGILDVNRLGQRGETMYGHDVDAYQKRISAFGWETIVIDGHNYEQIAESYRRVLNVQDKPTMIIAKTMKGKGVSLFEDKNGWHGKALSVEELELALVELGQVNKTVRGMITQPEKIEVNNVIPGTPREARETPESNDNLDVGQASMTNYSIDKPVATRKAYGNALVKLVSSQENIQVLDAEVSNSTYSEFVKKDHPGRFFEMFIAEQNMAGTAQGFAYCGSIPFISTFAAFFTRAFDQIRMGGLSNLHIIYTGSHAGVSIGEDGSSQMGLEDLAMFRSVWGSTVLYPSDAVSTEKLVEAAAAHHGSVYIRTTRKETNILYDNSEQFPIGGSKVHKQQRAEGKGQSGKVILIGAGVTLHEALAAQKQLSEEGFEVVVIDCYSIKPIDKETILSESADAKAILVVEDHYEEGGLGEAVRMATTDSKVSLYSLAVCKLPRSGKPQELLDYEEISSAAIIAKVKQLV